MSEPIAKIQGSSASTFSKNVVSSYLGVAPQLHVQNCVPSGTPATDFTYDETSGVFTPLPSSSTITNTIFSRSHLVYRGKKTTRVKQIVVSFAKAKYTHQTISLFGSKYVTNPNNSADPNQMVPFTTPVLIDNTNLTVAWIGLYVTKGDLSGRWIQNAYPSDAPGYNSTRTLHRTYDQTGLIRMAADIQAWDGIFFQNSDYTAPALKTFASRMGPLGAARPPYLPPRSVWGAPFSTATPAQIQNGIAALRSGVCIHQTWPGMSCGFDTGIFASGYYWRSGPELPYFMWQAPYNSPMPAHGYTNMTQYVWGDSTLEQCIQQFGVCEGTTVIDIDLEIHADHCLMIIPSIRPHVVIANKRRLGLGNYGTLVGDSSSLLQYSDPAMELSSTGTLSTLIPNCIPSDSTLTLCPPLNAVNPPAGSPLSGMWIMPNDTTIPQVQTGFTLCVCENAFYDGADFWYYLELIASGQNPKPEGARWSNGPSEVLPSHAVPFFTCTLNFE